MYLSRITTRCLSLGSTYCIHISIHSPIYATIHPSIHPSMHSSIHISIIISIHPSIVFSQHTYTPYLSQAAMLALQTINCIMDKVVPPTLIQLEKLLYTNQVSVFHSIFKNLTGYTFIVDD